MRGAMWISVMAVAASTDVCPTSQERDAALAICRTLKHSTYDGDVTH